MLETAELGRTLDKAQYKEALPALRRTLLDLQFQLRDTDRTIILILEGLDNATKGEVANVLNDWLDTRGVEFHAFGPKSDEELERPRFWRYWRALPGRGRIGIFHSSWYTGTLVQYALGQIDDDTFDRHMQRISRFERMLAHDGAVFVKLWLHRSEKHQKTYLKQLDHEPNARWMVSKLDHTLHASYHRLVAGAERAMRHTDHREAPWTAIEAADHRYRNLMAGEHLRAALAGESLVDVSKVHREHHHTDGTILDKLDLDQKLSKKDYRQAIDEKLLTLNKLSWQAYHAGVSLSLVFEGWDAAGKGGAIRRIMRGIDARVAQVIQIAAPNDEERAHHYLWRFWRHVPRAGRVTIYDRSWYGRVLVERVEGLTPEHRWHEAYAEINDFEEQQVEHGVVVLKFWLHIDPETQLRRFNKRLETSYKHYKLTNEDWRNRDKWPTYAEAVEEMISRTSTDIAPWHLIAANDKRYTRIRVLEIVCEALKARLHDQAHKERHKHKSALNGDE
ncbi:polyphosphate:AMP phosphotransferase [Mangrovitalea sediminis]|uniref:polyphosphate:AMP phosphotransferase n=1 Tax=Mangrovitalea sediminis TaxID=1982043 RepID=UPI000BE4DBDF|nr:polyphosphate:AMP phosphotransferase [Mangrovitalea sediminis]